MSSRLTDTFARLRAAKRTGLVTFLTAGDPSLDRSPDLLAALERGGADVIEVGVPFSDPLADGPVIQRASERALAGGCTLAKTLDMLEQSRESIGVPIVLFTYANPIVRYGVERFADRAAGVGVDGVLILDLPIEEARPYRSILAERGLDPIYLLSPTTTAERISGAASMGSGFLYVISRLGVTGRRDTLSEDARVVTERIRQVTDMPLALGFGLSRPEHVQAVGQWADAAVVGSALVEVIERSRDADVSGAAESFVRWLNGDGDVSKMEHPWLS